MKLRFWHTALAIALVWAAVYLPGLGTPELKGEEGRRILPALGMLASGDWVVPFMEGRPYVRKPPLINWAIAAAVRASGSHAEWAVRLPSAISILFLAWVAMACGRGLVATAGPRPITPNAAALVIGIATLTTAGLVEKGRLAEIEALYLSLTGISIALWAGLWRSESSRWLTWSVPWLFLGLGLLCKGPPHLVFFYGIVIATLAKDKSLRELIHPAHLVGLVLMLAVFLPWAWLCRERVGVLDSELDAGRTWMEQITHRLSFRQFDFAGWILSPVTAFVLFLPWAIPVVVYWRRIPQLAGSAPGRDRSLILGLRTGTLITAVVILLVPETRARFIQPLALPLIWLAALVVCHALPAVWQSAWTRIALGFLLLLTLAGILLPLAIPGGLSQPVDALTAGIFSFGASVALWRLWLRFRLSEQPVRLALATAFAAALFSVVAAASVLPSLRRFDNMRPVGAAISNYVAPHELVIFNPGRNPDPFHWRYYLSVPHSVVGKLSAVPRDAPFLLIEEHELDDDSATATRVREKLGFAHTVARLYDNEGRPFLLLTRLPPALPANPAGPRVGSD